ncbi:MULTISPECIES: DUF4192 family protein [Microbacterium]|uniref:DUF4192 family protein n=1 Tax=Microbacterium TaxID=33882 RepID=UPI0018895E66|nr:MULTISPECIES: DUF4192 family protein [Microbacterium]|tara:strand:+ start:50 stop:235 length:186 start_codon:yes stop_codon:yes gene_type:complete
MSMIVKATSAGAFLSMIPGVLGYAPVRSLVLVPFVQGRTVGAMRADMPPVDALRRTQPRTG